MASPYRLPIFPLPLVLLPKAVQPLHIFEPRYRQLLRDCLDSGGSFGIVCRTPDIAEREIEEGTAGCVARIDTSQTLPDGRSNVLVTGTERFSLVGFVEDPAPYHVARVEEFTDQDEPIEEMLPLAARLRDIFVRVGRSARALQDDTTPLPDLPEAPADLSFAIAQYIDLELGEKQRLLASRSPMARLRQLNEVLAPIVESIESRSRVHARARTNGHGAHG